jgi:hypothetical protein
MPWLAAISASLTVRLWLLTSLPCWHVFPRRARRQSVDPGLDAAESEELLSKVNMLQGLFQILSVTVFLALWVSRGRRGKGARQGSRPARQHSSY